MILAERGGFEPPIPFRGIHAFQACLFSHSSTFPSSAVKDAIEYQIKQYHDKHSIAIRTAKLSLFGQNTINNYSFYISLRKLSRFYTKNTFYVLISHLCNLFFTDTISSCQGLHDLYYKGTFITLTTIWNRSHIRTICL